MATSAILFAKVGGSVLALLLPPLLLLYALINIRNIVRISTASSALLILPLLCLASALWSSLPSTTMYYATLYLFTALLGVFIGSNKNRPAIYGLLAAFFVHAIASFSFGEFGSWGGDLLSGPGATAFIGLMGSKNSTADAAGVGAVAAMAALSQAIRDRQVVPALAALIAIPIDLWILKNAHSTGASVVFILGSASLITMTAGRILPTQIRMAVFAILALAMIGAAATQHLWLEPVMNAVADASGKDRTLTGRTYIWSRADMAIRARPVTGAGYAAFWTKGNLEAEAIWRALGVGHPNTFAFNFHNTPRELTVHLGYFGLALYGVVAFASAVALFIRNTWRPTAFSIFCCSYLVMVIPRLGVESVGFSPVSMATVLIFAALSSAWQRGGSTPRRT